MTAGHREAILDQFTRQAAEAELSRMENRRDPSRVHAPQCGELMDLLRAVGLPEPHVAQVSPRDRTGGPRLLSHACPLPGDRDQIRALFTAAIDDDRLGPSTLARRRRSYRSSQAARSRPP